MSTSVLDPLVELYEADPATVILRTDHVRLQLRGKHIRAQLRTLAETTSARWPDQLTGLAEALAGYGLLLPTPVAPRPAAVVPAGFTATSAACARFAAALAPRLRDPRPHILVSDGYLRQQHTHLDRSGRPWLLIKPGPRLTTISPVFGPGSLRCWDCVRARILGRDDLLAAAQSGDWTQMTVAADRSFSEDLLAVARAGIEASQTSTPDVVRLIHDNGPTVTLHPITPVPSCRRCRTAPVRLSWQLPSGELWPQVAHSLGHLLDPIAGVISERGARMTSSGIAVAAAAYSPPVTEQVARRTDLASLDEGHFGYGAGVTLDDAKARAHLEAAERYSSIGRISDIHRVACLNDLGDVAIGPNEFMRFSDTQFREAAELPRGRSEVPLPCAADTVLRWCPVTTLSGHPRLAPLGVCARPTGHARDSRFCAYDSTGTAVSFRRDQAIVSGFLEVIERDAVAIWWYNRTPRPAIDLASFADPFIDRTLAAQHDAGWRLTVFDLTIDVDIPVVAALAVHPDSAAPYLGFGAHFDAHHAVHAALLELTQAQFFWDSIENGWHGFDWAAQHQLIPAEGPAVTRASYPPVPREATVENCAAVAPAEALVWDCTRADITLPCVKVLIPGCYGFAPRFAPGRLTEVPVRLGLLDAAPTVFNPEPFRR